jgi:hypothetical protein
MSNIVEFPLPTGIVSEEFIAELHSNAFRDLEMSLRDCRKMGDIAAGLMSSHRFADPFTPENESLLFAVLHLANMLTKLEKEYDARWHGEVRDDDPGG